MNLVDVGNYRVEISEDRSTVAVDWKFFDPGQGLRLTILHSDKGEPKIAVSGRFFDTVLREEAKSTIKTQSNSVFPFLMGLVVVALSSILILMEWKKDRARIDKISIGFGVAIFSQGILLIASYYYGLYFATVSPV